MKNALLFATGFALTATMFFSCKKNDTVTPISTVQSTKAFIEKYSPATQKFTFNVSSLPQTLSLQSGTKLTIPQGAFTVDGRPATGSITVEVMEMMNRSSLVRAGVNTNHISGLPLVSQGSFFFDAKVNGVDADRRLAELVEFKVPAKDADFTQIWIGREDTLAGRDALQFGWDQPVRRQGVNLEVKKSEGNFIFNFGSLGWINCDVFYSYSNPKTTVRVALQNNPGTLASFRANTGETYVYFCAKGSNVVAQFYYPDGPNGAKSYDNSMPIGVEGRLISFSIKNGQFFLAKKDITISANQQETLVLAPSTESAIQSEIDALSNL
ncbi:hypothetical protein LX64_02451 [Chitinophaga skermanii]|uniref:Uncharacterized protein n=1 Tax=Chitinophaga skermanii TaxID=331697 RepID=A0A327QNM3_9BACT|nr:hypothetical protein [Chitinophaga skermanii]RAJ05294.1 hypothetical protein LX64_02451 [Chitinophaga skermanii]